MRLNLNRDTLPLRRYWTDDEVAHRERLTGHLPSADVAHDTAAATFLVDHGEAQRVVARVHHDAPDKSERLVGAARAWRQRHLLEERGGDLALVVHHDEANGVLAWLGTGFIDLRRDDEPHFAAVGILLRERGRAQRQTGYRERRRQRLSQRRLRLLACTTREARW